MVFQKKFQYQGKCFSFHRIRILYNTANAIELTTAKPLLRTRFDIYFCISHLNCSKV